MGVALGLEESADRFQFLLGKGFTVVIVRHGSSPRYHVPDAVSDVRRAVRFVRYNAKQWGVDPNRLGVHGGSAGGHLSLVLGMASDAGDASAEEPFMRASDRVASVVAYYPPVDLRTMARGAVPATEGQRFPALNFEKEKAADISPILFVTPDDPPTLLIHGDADTTVNISHSQRMFQALGKHNQVELHHASRRRPWLQGRRRAEGPGCAPQWFEETLKKIITG
jgi:acetyl esterase/lipase